MTPCCAMRRAVHGETGVNHIVLAVTIGDARLRARYPDGVLLAVMDMRRRCFDGTCWHLAQAVDVQGDFSTSDAEAAGQLFVPQTWTVPDVRFCNVRNRERRTTVKKLILTAALVACASPALAGGYVSTLGCKYSFFYGYTHCKSTWTEVADPVRDPEQERQDAIARQKEEAKWKEFCKPVFKADEYGVRRASYAKAGCEFGRSE